MCPITEDLGFPAILASLLETFFLLSRHFYLLFMCFKFLNFALVICFSFAGWCAGYEWCYCSVSMVRDCGSSPKKNMIHYGFKADVSGSLSMQWKNVQFQKEARSKLVQVQLNHNQNRRDDWDLQEDGNLWILTTWKLLLRLNSFGSKWVMMGKSGEANNSMQIDLQIFLKCRVCRWLFLSCGNFLVFRKFILPFDLSWFCVCY